MNRLIAADWGMLITVPLVVLSLVGNTFAHMQLASPYPIRSPLNPAHKGEANIDYSYTAPLAPDGSNYPCKGYHVNAYNIASVQTYNAGEQYQFVIGGSAVHGGGSCQVSLSYDNGATFKVIHSIMGGCPIDRTYDFTIPADAPSKEKALFAWTWFNRQGNREMYMNCAVVDIVGSKAKTNPKAFVMPEIFKANIFGVATCITKEGVDIVFPNPGKSIKYGGPYAGNPPKGFTVVDGCPRTNNQDGAGNREQNINSPNPILEQKPSSAEKETTTSVVEKQMFTSRPMVTMTPIIIKTLTTVAEPEKTTTMTVEEMTNITRTRNSTQTSVPVPILTILTSKVKLSTVKPTTLMTATRKYAAITQTVTVTHTTRVGRPIPSATTPPNNVDKATSTKPTSTKPTSIQLPTPEPTKTPENVQCTPGKVICLDLHHLAMCVDNSIKNAISLGPAPEGTVCVDGGLIHAGNLQNGRCNKEDARKIKCTDGGKGWEKCDGSWWIHMGRVAEGTGCVDGEIQAI